MIQTIAADKLTLYDLEQRFNLHQTMGSESPSVECRLKAGQL
ncbi:MAG TPA: hypothetical protein V6D50_19800 [Chroococcales cyanobacterium]|jgi:hypothetical protein